MLEGHFFFEVDCKEEGIQVGGWASDERQHTVVPCGLIAAEISVDVPMRIDEVSLRMIDVVDCS